MGVTLTGNEQAMVRLGANRLLIVNDEASLDQLLENIQSRAGDEVLVADGEEVENLGSFLGLPSVAGHPTGVPTVNCPGPHYPPKGPKIAGMSLNEFFTQGGGSQDDRKLWTEIQQRDQAERADHIATLTDGLDGEAQAVVANSYASWPTAALRVAAGQRKKEQAPAAPYPGTTAPVANYMGATGAPPYGSSVVINEQPLVAPSLY